MDKQKVERKNAWSNTDDMILATTVLDHIKKGSTQTKAFEEAAQLLSRSPSASAFRWNGVVRQQYESELLTIKEKITVYMETQLEKEYMSLQSSSVDTHDLLNQLSKSIHDMQNKLITMSNCVTQLGLTIKQRN
ncbi:hypothetical protein [Paenibacillus glacialis]|uniref:Transcriptional regulator n=1 Tax=Paenibacillus glacialis TaxID=494026 RepID=A0A168C2Y6_9BACL|nr:hypothetical protein [Paenibacillus glacialis]OAB32998.1 hypothetical protein PGLA_26325 [Paenibacillus glacialis]